jgi:hypothetical protein
MNAAGRILLATAIGTSFITLYSYWKSKKEKEEFTEPILLNELSDRSPELPSIDDTEDHPAGWTTHYAVGLVFVICYYALWKRSLTHPTLLKGLLLGSGSGIIAIAAWKIMFAANPNPPKNDREGYYRQLFIAHLIFSTTALYGYKLPDYIKRLS